MLVIEALDEGTVPRAIVDQLRSEMADFLEYRPLLDLPALLGRTLPDPMAPTVANVLEPRFKNLRDGK